MGWWMDRETDRLIGFVCRNKEIVVKNTINALNLSTLESDNYMARTISLSDLMEVINKVTIATTINVSVYNNLFNTTSKP